MSGHDALLAELRRDIADERVLAAVAAVPREAFVDPQDLTRAYDNVALGIDCGQTISQPFVVARMCELLAVRPGDRVLDVGTGSGYNAAVLAQLGARVTGVEWHPELARLAEARLGGRVRVIAGDGRLGWPEGAPYDGICVAAAAGDAPAALLEQLAEGGRLVAPLRTGSGERLVRITRRAGGDVREEFESVRFVPLV